MLRATCRTLRTSAATTATSARAPAPAAASTWRLASTSTSSSQQQAPPPQAHAATGATTATAPPAPTLPSSALPASAPTTPSHYLVTLVRSPLHLGPSARGALASLGLHSKRLASVVVPVSRESAGALLAVKELVAVREVSDAEVRAWASNEWREREGEGRRGAGMRVSERAGQRGVIRVGSERARGDERGFRIVARPFEVKSWGWESPLLRGMHKGET
ncbi:hypothetical protein Rhopal_007319-T1 [Rhodotorula paludigena]|uniref:Large ribosomal subunit protein uL30-like ferredoxin-like fold domain-containing protein n=1 Tax=Rhodotorula paludigena TaxID=86838 RepID=A0AAV5GXQ6_9BASI|nr:hypothetical protein Rhopal_007319-T1 [Rhodotorula paludigena]